MQKLLQINFSKLVFILIIILASNVLYAEPKTIDRIQLAGQQISMLKNRLTQTEQELTTLQREHDQQVSQLTLEKASKNILDKAALDISVAKSNLDSTTIELVDTQQSVNWLEKNIQEIDNQLNIMAMFGLKTAQDEILNKQSLHSDLVYQQKLLTLEKNRVQYLQNLQNNLKNIVQFKHEKFNRIENLLKSRNMLLIKQQQMRDELFYEEQQNQWLEKLNILYNEISKIDPVQSRIQYSMLERDIFFANESANYAYIQSLIARYKDQIQQMKLTVLRSNSISLLNEVSDQAQILTKQIHKLNNVLDSRIKLLSKHITSLSAKKNTNQKIRTYLQNLSTLNDRYQLLVA